MSGVGGFKTSLTEPINSMTEVKQNRYTCPQCGCTNISTIHSDSYWCNSPSCRASYNPETMKVTYVPVRYAIGFCPRCGTNARNHQCTDVAQESPIENDSLRVCFECPQCDYFWSDTRLARESEVPSSDATTRPKVGK